MCLICIYLKKHSNLVLFFEQNLMNFTFLLKKHIWFMYLTVELTA